MEPSDPMFRLAIYVATAVFSIAVAGIFAVLISSMQSKKRKVSRGRKAADTLSQLSRSGLRQELIEIQNDLMAGGAASAARTRLRSLLLQVAGSSSEAREMARELSRELPEPSVKSAELVQLLMDWIKRTT